MPGKSVADRILEKAEIVVGSSHQCPVLALVHAKEFLSLSLCKNDFVGFLVESGPRPVASAANGKRNLVGRTSESRIIAVGGDIHGGIDRCLTADVLLVFGGDIHHRQRAGRRNSKQSGSTSQQE